MIISQLELKLPVVQLAVLCALTLYAMRLGTEDSFFPLVDSLLIALRKTVKRTQNHQLCKQVGGKVGGEGRGDWCLPKNSGYGFILPHICCTFTKTFPD